METVAEDDRDNNGQNIRDIRPDPDPTRLTTLAQQAAISAVREILQGAIHTVERVMETRLHAMDTALRLLQDETNKTPAYVDMKVAHLQELVNQVSEEKFLSIEKQFTERDTRVEQMSIASKEAVTTALQAAKEAVAAALQAAKEAVGAQNIASTTAIQKSETSTDKRIDETVRLLTSTTSALETRIAIVTESSKNTMTRQEVAQMFQAITDKIDGPAGLSIRVQAMDSRIAGRSEQSQTNTQGNQWLIGIALAVIGLFVGILFNLIKH